MASEKSNGLIDQKGNDDVRKALEKNDGSILKKTIAKRKSGSEEHELAQKKLRILLVYEESALASTVASYIGISGHDAKVSKDSDDALEIYKAGGIDIVMINLNWPRMDGLETRNRLLKIDPKVRIIINTGALLGQRELEMMKGIVILEKPFSLDDLKKKINEVLQLNKQALG